MEGKACGRVCGAAPPAWAEGGRVASRGPGAGRAEVCWALQGATCLAWQPGGPRRPSFLSACGADRGLCSERLLPLKGLVLCCLDVARPCRAVCSSAGSPLGDAAAASEEPRRPWAAFPCQACAASCGPWRSCTQPFPAEFCALTDPGTFHQMPRLRAPWASPCRHVTLLKSLDPHSCPASEAPPACPLRGGMAFGHTGRPGRQRRRPGWLGRSQ